MKLHELRDAASGSRSFADDTDLRAAFPRLAYYRSMWAYYEAATQTTPEDLSLLETDDDGLPTFGFLAGKADSAVSFFRTPAIAELADSGHGIRRDRLGRAVAEEVIGLHSETDSSPLAVCVLSDSSRLTGFDLALLSAGARTQSQFSAEVDLTWPEEAIWSSIRPRYRSLINRGRRILEMEEANVDRPDRAVFDTYRLLHREVAGEQTRPDRSWDEMWQRIAQDQAQLLVARLDGRPVAATFVTTFGDLAVYASGAYVRDLGNFPVSHWPMYASILAAKRSGRSRFLLGAAYFDQAVEASEKLRSIANFKRGFATEVVLHRQYVLGTERGGDGDGKE